MDGVKIIAMLLAIWGFATYIYQNYLDDSKDRTSVSVLDLFSGQVISDALVRKKVLKTYAQATYNNG
ncbi:unnamed protein product [Prunus armeniaca]|uniref:Uncharacterized protein n=1 Tax=Prunus armeniaca TaxID=36596 RepID=A0A6J5WDC0_PRUAR|nr:unnamed protein product [Prunus armeniaca]CAB4299740.1 unnamed protein product [Prunus armeniaca]